MLSAQYFMEDPREAKRLGRKVDADRWVAQYLAPWLPTTGKVLEVGCGPGSLAIAAGVRMPTVEVMGLDLNPDRFSQSLAGLPPNVKLEQAEAGHLPFPADTYDLVYSRFLLEYLPGRQGAVREMVRVCRPGGRVLLQDLDGQLLWHHPEDAKLQSGIAQIISGLEKLGFDPFAGRKLFSLLNSFRMKDVRVAAESYHLYAGAIDPGNLELWETKLDIVLPAAAKILGSETAARALKRRFLEYLRRDDTLTYSVAFTVVGQKPPQAL
jgi:ubiquinone/menaquinone biosynthesis C-methylase UbiE